MLDIIDAFQDKFDEKILILHIKYGVKRVNKRIQFLYGDLYNDT